MKLTDLSDLFLSQSYVDEDGSELTLYPFSVSDDETVVSKVSHSDRILL